MADNGRVFNNNKTMDYAKKESINRLKAKIDRYSKTMETDKATVEDIKKSIENLNDEVSTIGEESRLKIEEFRNKITSYVSQLQTYQLKNDFQDKFDDLENLNVDEYINNNTDFLSSVVDNQMNPSDAHYDDILEENKNLSSRHTQIIHCDIIDGWDNVELFSKKYGYREFDKFIKNLNKRCIKIPITVNLKTIEFGLVYRQKYSCTTEANELVLERYFTGKMFFSNCDAQENRADKKFEVRGIIFNADNTDERDIDEIGPVIKFKIVKDKEYIYLFLDDITPYRFLPVLEKIEGSNEKKLKLIDIIQHHTRTNKFESILGPNSGDYYDRNNDKIIIDDTIGINFEVKLSVLDFTSYNDKKSLEVFDFVSIDETQIDKKDSREFVIKPAPVGLVQLIGFEYTQNEAEDVVNKIGQIEKKYFKNFELEENPELNKPVHKRRPIQTNLLNWRKPQKYQVSNPAAWKDGKGETMSEKDFRRPPDNYLDGLPFGAPLIGSTYALEDLDPVSGSGINFKNLRIIGETSEHYIGILEGDMSMFASGNIANRFSYAKTDIGGPILHLFGTGNSIYDSKYDNTSMGLIQSINGEYVKSYEDLDKKMGHMKKMTRMFTEEGYEKLLITGKKKILQTDNLYQFKSYFDKDMPQLRNLMYPGVHSVFEGIEQDLSEDAAHYTHTIAYDAKTNYLYYMKITEGQTRDNGVVYKKDVSKKISNIFKIFTDDDFRISGIHDTMLNEFNLWIDDMNNNNIFPNYQKSLIFTFFTINNTLWGTDIPSHSAEDAKNVRRVGSEYYKYMEHPMTNMQYFLLKDKTKDTDKTEYIGQGWIMGGFEPDGRNGVISSGWLTRLRQSAGYTRYTLTSGVQEAGAMIGYGRSIGSTLPYKATLNPVIITAKLEVDKNQRQLNFTSLISDKKGGHVAQVATLHPWTPYPLFSSDKKFDSSRSIGASYEVSFYSVETKFDSSRSIGAPYTLLFRHKRNSDSWNEKTTVAEYGSRYYLIGPRLSQFNGVMDGVFLGFANNMTRDVDSTFGRFWLNTGTSSAENMSELFVSHSHKNDENDKSNGLPFSIPNAYDKYSHLYISLIAKRRVNYGHDISSAYYHFPFQYSYLEFTTRRKTNFWKPMYWVYINKSNYQYTIKETLNAIHNSGVDLKSDRTAKTLFWDLFRSNNSYFSNSNNRFIHEGLTINPTDTVVPINWSNIVMTNNFSFEIVHNLQKKIEILAFILKNNTHEPASENILPEFLDNDKSIIPNLYTNILKIDGSNNTNMNLSTLVLKGYPNWKDTFNNSTFEHNEILRTRMKVISSKEGIEKLFITSPCYVGLYARETQGSETNDGFIFPAVLPDKIYSDDGRVLKPNSESINTIQYFTIIPNIFNTGQDLWFIEVINLGNLKRSEHNITRTKILYRLAPTLFKYSKITEKDKEAFPFKTTPALLDNKWDRTEAKDAGWKTIEINREVNLRENPNFPYAAFILSSYFDEQNKKLVCFLSPSKGLGDMAFDRVFEDINKDEKSFNDESNIYAKFGVNVSTEYAALVFDLTDLNNLTFTVSKSKDWTPWSMLDTDQIGYEYKNMKYLIGEDSEGKYLVHPNKGIIYDISDYSNIKKRKNQKFLTTQVLYNEVRKSYVYITNTSDEEYRDEKTLFKGPALTEVPCYDIVYKDKSLSEEIKEYLKERYDNNGGNDLMVEITVKMRAENLGLYNGSLERVPKFKFTELGVYNPYSSTNKLVRYIDKITMYDDYYPRNQWIDDRRRWEFEAIVDKKQLNDRFILDKRKNLELFFGGNIRENLRLTKMINSPLEGLESLDAITTPAVVEVTIYPTKADFKNISYIISKKQDDNYDAKPDAHKNNMVRGFIDDREIFHNIISDSEEDSTVDIDNPNIWELDRDMEEISFVDSYETLHGSIKQMAVMSDKYLVYNGGARLEVYDRVNSRNEVMDIGLPIRDLGPFIVTSKSFYENKELAIAAIRSDDLVEKGFLAYFNNRYYKLFINDYLFGDEHLHTYKFDKNNNLWIISRESNKWFVDIYKLSYVDNNIEVNQIDRYELTDVPEKTDELQSEAVYLSIDNVNNNAFVVFTALKKMYQIILNSTNSSSGKRVIGKEFNNPDEINYYIFAQRNFEGFGMINCESLDVSNSSTIDTLNPLSTEIFTTGVVNNINYKYSDGIKTFKATEAFTLRDNSIIVVGRMYNAEDELIENNYVYLYDKAKGNTLNLYKLPIAGEDAIMIDKVAYSLRNDRLLVSTKSESQKKRVYVLKINYKMK